MSTPRSGGRRADAVRNRQLALEAATALLSEPGAALTVEAIAGRAGLGAGTVVRAFGGKDALLDAAVSDLLEPVVRRARELCGHPEPDLALRTFLAELIAFQSAHHPLNDRLGGLDLPATTARRAELVAAVEEMLDRAQAAGLVRTDLEAPALTTLIGQTAYAVARSRPAAPELVDAYLTVLMDGLRPPR
ncbi:TetR/AcrR family transcriptional regulator [Kitasatospora terrestris]|uniref:TetR/AcrR family transcriptional regulator n=1 Tax=Kitasatospora terrestris TaxID=258051 RepID=A0ABP9DY59_9ACTN